MFKFLAHRMDLLKLAAGSLSQADQQQASAMTPPPMPPQPAAPMAGGDPNAPMDPNDPNAQMGGPIPATVANPNDPVVQENRKLQILSDNMTLKIHLLDLAKQIKSAKKEIKTQPVNQSPIDPDTGLRVTPKANTIVSSPSADA